MSKGMLLIPSVLTALFIASTNAMESSPHNGD